jgi:DNA-binding Xre family transcriptional regulator
MKTIIKGSSIAIVSFVDQFRVKVVLPDNTYIVGFSSNHNYIENEKAIDGHFLKLMGFLFDFNMYFIPRPDFNTAVRNIDSDLYRNGYEMMSFLMPEQNVIDERVRIGTKIKELRQKQNIDAKTLARRAGIDASNLSRIEQGRYSVGFDVLSKIANALNAQVDIVEK